MENNIIIIGGSHHNTLSMIRSLGDTGYIITLILVGCRNSFVAYSKYIDNYYYVNNSIDIISLLVTIKRSIKDILISCSDDVSQIIDLNYNILSPYYYFFNCGKEKSLSLFLDKKIQTELAQNLGMNIPKTIKHCSEDSFEVFPCLLKPLESVNGGKKIIICKNKDDYKNALLNFKHTPILIQEYIEKSSEIVIVGAAYNNNIVIPGYIYKIREISGGTTYSQVKRISNIDLSLIELCKKYIRNLNYNGLFGIEFIQNKDGLYYFIEINLRNDATTYSIVKAGVNLPLLYCHMISDKRVTIESYQLKEIYSIVDFRDLSCAKNLHIPFTSWLRQYFKAECKYIFDFKDMFPFWKYLFDFVESKLLNKK